MKYYLFDSYYYHFCKKIFKLNFFVITYLVFGLLFLMNIFISISIFQCIFYQLLVMKFNLMNYSLIYFVKIWIDIYSLLVLFTKSMDLLLMMSIFSSNHKFIIIFLISQILDYDFI